VEVEVVPTYHSTTFHTTPPPVVAPREESELIRHKVQRERLIPAETRMEDTFQIPVVATLVFVLTMIAIFYMGRVVEGYYEPVLVDGRIEFQGRSS